MSLKIENARLLLSVVRARTDKIGVAYSGGKDSMVCMDLACDMGFKVSAFHAVRIFDMKIVDDICRYALKKWDVDVKIYPWFMGINEIRSGKLTTRETNKDVPKLSLREIEDAFRRETNVEWIVHGWRASDSIIRAIILSRYGGIDMENKRVYPLRRWKRDDIYSYLRQKKINHPYQFGREEQAGIDLYPQSILFLKKYYPEDYEKFKKVYTYVETREKNTTAY